MIHVQEEIACDLHRTLKERRSESGGASISLNGAGVHWQCNIVDGDRSCVVHCFEYRHYEVRSPEYLAAFRQGRETRAMGRTLSKDEIVNAVLLWIRGASLQELYGKFRFVDREKRALESLSAAMISAQPILASSVKFDLRPIANDLFELLCLAQDRDCKFSFWGKNEIPLATFHWDDCPMFSIPAGDAQEMAHLLKSWLCDFANPSAVKSENPKIDLRSVAAYYEQGNRIEGEFIESWDKIEQFYEEEQKFVPSAKLILPFVRALRSRGYDRHLRAGQSMLNLILSRSRRHGLRQNQPAITFHFRCEGGANVRGNYDSQELNLPQLELTPPLEDLLRKLEKLPID